MRRRISIKNYYTNEILEQIYIDNRTVKLDTLAIGEDQYSKKTVLTTNSRIATILGYLLENRGQRIRNITYTGFNPSVFFDQIDHTSKFEYIHSFHLIV